MYATDFIMPAVASWQVDRTLPNTARPITAQQTDFTQERVITIACATLEECATLVRELQDDGDWKHEVAPQLAAIADGVDRYSGTITCRRYLAFDSQPAVSYTIIRSE